MKSLRIFLISIIILSSIIVTGMQVSNAQTGTTMPNDIQLVVDSLESKGFDVTFVYFGSNKNLTFGTEDSAVVVMKTTEHVKNFQFTTNQELQFREGNNTLHEAYPNAEVFIVFIFEDLDNDGIPDGSPQSNGYYEVSGGVFGGRTSTAFPNDYWNQADKYILMNLITPTPTPSATPTSTPPPTITPTPQPTQAPSSNPTTQPTSNPTTNPTTQPTQNPTTNPTTSQIQNIVDPTPTAPELTTILLLPLFALILFGAAVVKLKKKANNYQS